MLIRKIRFIFNAMTRTAKSGIQTIYGADFYRRFAVLSRQHLESMLPRVQDIGDSIFAFNYLYGPCYFAWYQTLRDLGVEKSSALNLIWQINEDFVKSIPTPLLRWFGKQMYLGTFRKRAVRAEQLGKAGQLHPFDWRIEYTDIDRNTFRIDIFECGMLKLADLFGYRELFPQVCRMDYLFSHYFHQSFRRSGTLADGNLCCDCWYQAPGACEWAPEKGFEYRK
ncbi:L-2-amino-thiazoline-4-carboxylic acid hydrolase [Longilinea arvoryzae]|uniref:L-2-amino-thiazoline-4-carboxylic acid hydrolase n=1 Tax=Longilinea arvoryzae TaxID=360412 RepID=A0A0S7BIZ7_9CHLR|nr:L-2-amino-thiazoline-4-carboxylic acid hydrolase [Longilinea arvoryzae]GAP13841.1 L-2-amino-thiazoline-4-carboxylic acid hydrolase [Longilinea arvoryzae]